MRRHNKVRALCAVFFIFFVGTGFVPTLESHEFYGEDKLLSRSELRPPKERRDCAEKKPLDLSQGLFACAQRRTIVPIQRENYSQQVSAAKKIGKGKTADREHIARLMKERKRYEIAQQNIKLLREGAATQEELLQFFGKPDTRLDAKTRNSSMIPALSENEEYWGYRFNFPGLPPDDCSGLILDLSMIIDKKNEKLTKLGILESAWLGSESK